MPNKIYVIEHNGEFIVSEHAWVDTETYVHKSLLMSLLNAMEYIQQLDSGDPNYRAKIDVIVRAALKQVPDAIKD